MNRRTFLYGAGSSVIGLPLLEAMFAEEQAIAQPAARPLRFAFLFYPNGAVDYEMSPTSLDELTGVLAPFEPLREHLISVNGLNNRANSTWERNGVDLGSGTPHEINAATFLTCQQLGSLDELRLSASIDQVIGEHLQARDGTRLSSLVIGDGDGRTDIGQGDVNRSYHHLMSWKSETQYVVPISRTSEVFAEIYAGSSNEGAPDAELEALRRQRRSILDSTSSQLTAMRQRVGRADQTRVDLYLETIRSVEQKLGAAPVELACPDSAEPPDLNPKSIDSFGPYLDTMSELIVLSLRCQLTPVATFQLSRGNDGVRSGVAGVSSDQHGVSHYRSGGSQDSLRRINVFYNERAAYFLQLLAETDELGYSLLESTVALYGSGIADADLHDGSNCPILIAGGQQHGVATHRVIDHGLSRKGYDEGTPLANLHLGLADLAGVPIDSFGDSNGRIDLTA
jgi:hypothetical protein